MTSTESALPNDQRSPFDIWRDAWYWAGCRYYRGRQWLREAPKRLRWARQRLIRGWDDLSVWGMNAYMSQVLGEQLVEMARIAHGNPMGQSYERWTADLRRHGDALLAYHRLVDDLTFDDPRAADVYQAAQDALRWMADNLADLWD